MHSVQEWKSFFRERNQYALLVSCLVYIVCIFNSVHSVPGWKLSAHTFREKPTWDDGRPSDHFHINASIWRGFTSSLLYEEVEITFTSSLLQEVALLWTLSISHHPFLEISLIIVIAFMVDDSNRGIEADFFDIINGVENNSLNNWCISTFILRHKTCEHGRIYLIYTHATSPPINCNISSLTKRF